MVNRVRDILLVSSPYDAFILEEDGRLSEQIFTEYSELNLSTAPRISQVSTAARAFEMMKRHRFDLVLTTTRLADADVRVFAREIKERFPLMKVATLILSEADLNFVGDGRRASAIDHLFLWTGDAGILLAIIKLFEDEMNAEEDTANGGVRVIIVVEDSVRRYSAFLSLLYRELMAQSSSLSAEGVNDLQRTLRMRARPKLLLARDYEQAMALYERFQDNLIALITDVRFPKEGEENALAGFDLVREIRIEQPTLAVLVQSAEPENARRAAELGVSFANKNSSNLMGRIHDFVNENLGFGDFIFRMPDDRREVGRARDVYELEERVRTVPAECLVQHAQHNHFSTWLMARSMFRAAEKMRTLKIEDVGGVEALRSYIVAQLEEVIERQQEGVISDFSPRRSKNRRFMRLGQGSLGGKARGVAFVNATLVRSGLENRFPEMKIRIPRSLAIPTDEFDAFIEKSGIRESEREQSTQAILRRCLAGDLSDVLKAKLRQTIEVSTSPLAVRSSSLLEDSQLLPFAGVYSTLMLPNNHPDPNVRFEQLCQAVKAVYASTFSEEARAYIAGTPYSAEDEKMAVLVQSMIGQRYGSRFYPSISGVCLSYNHYPLGHQRAEDGLAMVALGLGAMVVQGGRSLHFSPATPKFLPQFATPQDFLRHGQSSFYALDMSRNEVNFLEGDAASLIECDLSDAEEDGTLALVGSTYDYEDDVIRDSLHEPGARLVTFNNLLKWEALPMAEAIHELLKVFSEGMGCPVEIEFALDQGDFGRVNPRWSPPYKPWLYVLQVRPQAAQMSGPKIDTQHLDEADVLCRTDRSLGHGIIEGIRDIVFVERERLEATDTPAIAREVGTLNAKLVAEGRPYLLVGPGRWGTSDPRLGIPVRWSEIAGAKVIVETDFGDREIEPSQGSHFFHNVTSFQIGYMTIAGMDRRATAYERRIDRDFLRGLPRFSESSGVVHVRLEAPLQVLLDGRKGRGAILKPGAHAPEML
jgi:DNA-binding NarL/FixJ family response regulator